MGRWRQGLAPDPGLIYKTTHVNCGLDIFQPFSKGLFVNRIVSRIHIEHHKCSYLTLIHVFDQSAERAVIALKKLIAVIFHRCALSTKETIDVCHKQLRIHIVDSRDHQ